MPSPTFYVSLLNPDFQLLGQDGLFTGKVTTSEVTTSTLAINIPLANIKSHFKFKSVAVAGDDDLTPFTSIDITGVVGVADGTAAAWTFPGSGVGSSALVIQDEFVGLLANKVFGSASAGDLFSNRAAVEAAWHTAAGTGALGSLKAKTYTSGINASKELIDAMFFSGENGPAKGMRFSMAYDATTDAVVNTSGAVATDVAVSGASGTGAKADVSATGISVRTTGSGYVAGGVVTIGELSSFKINSVQAAMLNGTLNHEDGTEVPLCAGDKIKVLFEIRSNANQKDVSNEAVSVTQKFNVEYTLTA